MSKNSIIDRIGGAAHRVSFKIKQHSPEILVVTGVVGVIASAVMACKATIKVSTIMDEAHETIEKIHDCSDNKELANKYSSEDAKRDLAIVYVQTGIKFVKLYAPSIIMGALSITSILASNNILRKRNVALAAAYATVDKSFKEYRNRVIERFGETVDHELKYGIKAKKIEEVVIDQDTGKEKKVKTTSDVTDGKLSSPWACCYEDICEDLDQSHDYNLMCLRAEQNYANDLLRSRGYVFLNEVYRRIGIPQTKAGQSVGWLYRPNDPNRDGYVDFGIFETRRTTDDGSYETITLLDFNVDGNILQDFEEAYREKSK